MNQLLVSLLRYDKHGKLAVQESAAAVDPATVFGMAFGSDVFEEYVGQLALATLASLGYEGGGDPTRDAQFHAKLQQLQQVGKEALRFYSRVGEVSAGDAGIYEGVSNLSRDAQLQCQAAAGGWEGYASPWSGRGVPSAAMRGRRFLHPPTPKPSTLFIICRSALPCWRRC